MMPNRDNMLRSGRCGLMQTHSLPDTLVRMTDLAVGQGGRRHAEDDLLVVELRNEWAKGNNLEPVVEHAHRFLCELLVRPLSADLPVREATRLAEHQTLCSHP